MKNIAFISFFLFLYFISSLDYEEFKGEDMINSLNNNLGASECSPVESDVKKYIADNHINYEGPIDARIKFIAGTCNPIVLIPGIYSTKLKVRLNCRNIKRSENSLYQKIKFYCNKYVCSNDLDDNENRDLWFNLGEKGFTLLNHITEPKLNEDEVEEEPKTEAKSILDYIEWDNRYSACLGLFMTMFNDEEECPIIESTKKKICGHSENIKISYEGGFQDSKNIADCGVKAVDNVLTSPLQHFPESFWKKKSNIFGALVDELVSRGYEQGFSLAAIPNDFRRFLSTNDFSYESLEYHVENLFNITGKPVIIIAHSFGNLVTLNGLQKYPHLKDKIKKWISLAPPFAGATKAIDYFLHGISDFNFNIIKGITKSQFHPLGQLMMMKSIPTVYELQPYTIFYKLFNSEEYSDFANAIRERINLEKNCKNTQCSQSDIELQSANFDLLFKDYFPSLTLPECAYENLEDNQNVNNKKCMSELFNIVDYPSIIKVKKDENNLDEDIYDIEEYYQKKGDDLYYIADAKDIKDSNYVENILSEVPYAYEKYESLITNFNNTYLKVYKKIIEKGDPKFFETKEEVKETIKKMSSYLKEISLIKDLPIPPVDIDLIYSSFNPTIAAEFIDEESLEVKQIENRGGDGTVPTWSSLLTGLKWIYEKKKKNLPQNIRLVEYCSRLANSNPNLEHFLPINCSCINEKSEYKDDLSDCSHQFMLSDTELFNYIFNEINKDKEIIENKKLAMEYYSQKRDYLDECNYKLYLLSDKDNRIKCSFDIEITEEQFKSGSFCAKHNFSTYPGRECCSLHIKGLNSDLEPFNEYLCYNVKTDKKYKNFLKNEIKDMMQFFDNVNIQDIEIDCPGSSFYLITSIYLLYLLILLI